MQNRKDEEVAVFETHVMPGMIKFPFENPEKLIMLELNPYAV